jgi:hypothetical protein
MNTSNPHKILSVALSAILFLSLGGCFNLGGSQTTQKPVDERSKVYETNEFTITVPKTWEVIEKKDFTSDVPAETVVVFRNNVKNETFTANMVIVKNTLQEPIATLEYAKMVLNRQKSGLYDYKESRRDETKITIGGNEDPTFFTLFEAKKSTEENSVRYLQTYGIKGKSAYIVTGAVSTQENDSVVKDIENMVKSFKLK